MDGMEMEQAIKDTVGHYGADQQLDILQEECAELIQVVSKYWRYGKERVDNLVEEIVNVDIMIKEVIYLLDIQEEQIKAMQIYKACRELRRIEKPKERNNNMEQTKRDRATEKYIVTHHEGKYRPIEVAANKVPEMVDHSNHYQMGGGVEVIDYIADVCGEEGCDAFDIGNALKYIGRAGRKFNAREDLCKAVWYLNYAISCLGKIKVAVPPNKSPE